ncbi:general stress protein [Leptolyngbya sp. FACHB-36]|uniref:general stress protein n=1 Tax=Leptolyngbya sp. FACHB-36 TaxID=2692808 RepID=UPI0016819762|nr:general stress protein [Leptolyngbya sp. FACHB-36]MBD2020981.1 general stress protein [Leptolyngbya sp. FACHB-36]
MQNDDKKRAVGVFANQQQAEQSLNELKASGFPMEHVSIVAKQVGEEEQVSGAEVTDRIGDQNVKTPLGVVKDTFAHSSWAFVLVGLTSLALPGIGPILAAGSLGAALAATTVGTGIGALAAHNVVKAFTHLGIPEAQASVYGDRLLQGDYLVMVEGSSDEIQSAEQVFSRQDIQDWGIYPAV